MDNIAHRPIFEPEDVAVLCGLIDRIAPSVAVSELSTEEAAVLYMLCDRMMNALWVSHRRELLTMFQAAILANQENEDEDE